MLRPFAHPVASCCAKFETGQTFQPTTPNISFVPWSPKRSATMLDPFAQLFQHCWGHARSLRMVYKDLWVVSFPWCTAGPNIVGSLASVCTPLPTRTQQLPTLLAQQCWELLRPLARSLRLLSCLAFSRRHSQRWFRGTQREYSSKVLKHSIVERILVFKR